MIQVDHEYHIIEFFHPHPSKELHRWVKENFGDGSGGRYFFKYPNLYFADAKDHLVFCLRWS